jgi:hypothetical protein
MREALVAFGAIMVNIGTPVRNAGNASEADADQAQQEAEDPNECY